MNPSHSSAAFFGQGRTPSFVQTLSIKRYKYFRFLVRCLCHTRMNLKRLVLPMILPHDLLDGDINIVAALSIQHMAIGHAPELTQIVIRTRYLDGRHLLFCL
uniref:Uncharacterized protein n=1 Tax=Leptocylindrus danicus TaxID=163516 RepID=A0A6U2NBT5_9STRA